MSDRTPTYENLDEFWTLELHDSLSHPAPVRSLLESLTTDVAATYDLLFYGAFTDKLLTIMRREGKDTDGFDRMQQSFRETVERVRNLVAQAGELGFLQASAYTQLSPEAMTKLLELTHDLAIVKQWSVRLSNSKN